MTTGNTTVDGTSVNSEGQRHGKTTRRTWDGGDSPKLPKVRQPKVYGLRARTNKFGTTTWVKVRRPAYKQTLTPKSTSRRSRYPNAYSATIVTTVNGLTALTDGRVFNCTNAGFTLNSPIGSLDPNLRLSLINKLREKLQGSDFNAGIVAAEARKTASLIVETSTKLSLALRQVKRGRFGDAAVTLTGHRPKEAHDAELGWRKLSKKSRNESQTVSSNWLQLQYGWLPLLHDVYSGAEALAHAHHQSGVTKFIVRGSRSTGSKRGPYLDPASSNAPKPGTAQLQPLGWKSAEQHQIVAYVKSHGAFDLLGLTDPASVLWEITPYSFVFDWFVPVGDYLAALAVSRTLTGLFVSTTTIRSGFDAVQYLGDPGYAPLGAKPYAISSCYVTRTVSNSLSVPLPAVKPIAKIASVSHALNALALVFARPPRTF